MEYKHFKTVNIDSNDDGYKSIIFIDQDGKHFHPVLVSKLLPDSIVEHIEKLIEKEINFYVII